MSEQEREPEVEGQGRIRLGKNEEPAQTPEEKAEQERKEQEPEVEGQPLKYR